MNIFISFVSEFVIFVKFIDIVLCIVLDEIILIRVCLDVLYIFGNVG